MHIVHAADIHLDSPMRGLSRYEGAPTEAIREATRRAFENLVDLTIEVEAPLLVLAGDLYDGDWPDYSTGLYFQSQMVRLRDANVRVALVRGNHDAQNRITRSLRLPDNVIDLPASAPKTHILEDLGIAIHGQSYARQKENRNLAASYPAAEPGLFNLGILHTSLDGRPGHEPYAPCHKDDLIQRGYDYWALGHVHVRETVHEDPWIVFPGNLQGRHARELGPKGACVIEVSDRKVVGVEFAECDVMRWAKAVVDAHGLDSREALVEAVGARVEELAAEAGARPLALRVAVAGATRAARELHTDREGLRADIQAEITSRTSGEGWLEKLIVEVSTPEREPAEAGPLAELIDMLDELASDPERLVGSMPELDALSRAVGPASDRRVHERLREVAARLQAELRDLLKTS